MATPRYGDLIRLGPDDGEVMEVLKRVPLGAGVSQGSVSEDALQNLLFRFPETLPIAAIDATYAGAVPICQELRTTAGFVDALYVNPLGQITLTEFKLWRNPQSRREVIGQILDYAKELALSRAAAKHTTVAERKCTTGVMPEGADLGVGVATGTVVGGPWEDYGPACSGAEDSVAFCRLPLRR